MEALSEGCLCRTVSFDNRGVLSCHSVCKQIRKIAKGFKDRFDETEGVTYSPDWVLIGLGCVLLNVFTHLHQPRGSLPSLGTVNVDVLYY